MKFLIKAAFWLGLVVLLLPVPDSERGSGKASVFTTDAIAFLSSAVNDIKGFCARNPDSCETGAAAVHGFGKKAQYGARILHEFISEKMKESDDLVPPKGSRRVAEQSAPQQQEMSKRSGNLNDTLSAQDRAAGWQGRRERQVAGRS